MLGKFLHLNSPVKTLTNLKLDWFSSVNNGVTKLKAHLSNFICDSFFFISLLEYSLIDRFQYSMAMEAPPHVYAEAPLNTLGFC